MPSKEFEALPNIYLVGPMGAGKTTVGRHLAELLGRDFVDSDHEIERKTGATIPWIFEKEGEQVIMAELVKASELHAKPEQIRALVEEMAQSYEDPSELVRWYYAQPERLAQAEAVVIEDNVVEWVCAKADTSDKAVAFDELMGNAA